MKSKTLIHRIFADGRNRFILGNDSISLGNSRHKKDNTNKNIRRKCKKS